MKKLVVALAVFAVSAGAYAKGMAAAGQSEFYHQAPAGESEGTAGLGIVLNGTASAGTTDTDFTGTRLFAMYERGLNDVWSIGATLGYTQLKIDTTPKTDHTGLDNLSVDLRGKHEGSGLRYGANLDLALGKHEVKTSGDENVQDGGMVLAPYVGYEWAQDNCMYGAKLSYGLRIQDEKSEDKTTSTTTKTKGDTATTLSGFYEHAMDAKWTLGGSLAYAMNSDSKPDGAAADVDNGTTMTLDVYAPIHDIGPGTLIPSVNYAKTSADVDVTATTLEVKYRMQF